MIWKSERTCHPVPFHTCSRSLSRESQRSPRHDSSNLALKDLKPTVTPRLPSNIWRLFSVSTPPWRWMHLQRNWHPSMLASRRHFWIASWPLLSAIHFPAPNSSRVTHRLKYWNSLFASHSRPTVKQPHGSDQPV